MRSIRAASAEWLTPERKKQWRSGGVFEVIGCDTGTRYLITYTSAMNIHQLDEAGLSVAQWCFVPKGDLAPGDVLLVQKIALETMEREVLALANRQPIVHRSSARRSDACARPTALVPRAATPPHSAPQSNRAVASILSGAALLHLEVCFLG
jgi:hypothetical protein